ncbi:MAG: MarR family transcriptional regulator [Chloroflexi bacterium]|nr:MarR family transcriptional regulator [Chloroflexota bacterium]
MSEDRQLVAREFLKVIPNLMWKVNYDLRCTRGGIEPSHFRLLALLESGPCNLSELAGRQSVSLATVSNTISTLAERGWVMRSPVSHDRRMIQVALTPYGQAVLAEILAHMESRVADMLEDLDDNQVLQLKTGVDLLSQILETAPEKDRDDCSPQSPKGGDQVG